MPDPKSKSHIIVQNREIKEERKSQVRQCKVGKVETSFSFFGKRNISFDAERNKQEHHVTKTNIHTTTYIKTTLGLSMKVFLAKLGAIPLRELGKVETS